MAIFAVTPATPSFDAANASGYSMDGATQALFDEHLEWASAIARKVSRKLPPSFDVDDLEQEARIEHWKRVRMYDSATGVPYRAYAYQPIWGACMMRCRRRNYREATHASLSESAEANDTRTHAELLVDPRPIPDKSFLLVEEEPASARRESWQLATIYSLLDNLPAEDAALVRRALAGASIEELVCFMPSARRRLAVASGRLKRAAATFEPPIKIETRKKRSSHTARLQTSGRALNALLAELLSRQSDCQTEMVERIDRARCSEHGG